MADSMTLAAYTRRQGCREIWALADLCRSNEALVLARKTFCQWVRIISLYRQNDPISPKWLSGIVNISTMVTNVPDCSRKAPLRYSFSCGDDHSRRSIKAGMQPGAAKVPSVSSRTGQLHMIRQACSTDRSRASAPEMGFLLSLDSVESAGLSFVRSKPFLTPDR
jgi:hypothetical protein